jgi:hypothetical protein
VSGDQADLSIEVREEGGVVVIAQMAFMVRRRREPLSPVPLH